MTVSDGQRLVEGEGLLQAFHFVARGVEILGVFQQQPEISFQELPALLDKAAAKARELLVKQLDDVKPVET